MKNLMFSLVVMILIGSTAECATWEAMDSGTTETLRDVWGTASDNVYAVGHSGTILHYNGNNWEQMSLPTTANLLGAWGTGPSNVYAVGGDNTILHYDGSLWAPVLGLPTGNISGLIDIWGSGPDNIFVTAEGTDNTIGHIIHWDGSSWSDITFSFPLVAGVLYEVWGRAADDVYVSGYNGYSSDTTGLMYHYDGNDWELFDVPQTRAIGGVWGAAGSSDLFLACQSYGGPSDWFAEALYYDGIDWETEIFQESHSLNEVWGNSQGDVYMIGYDGMVLHGSSNFIWSQMDSGTTETLNGIWGNDSGNVFVVGVNGTILRLLDPIEEILDFIDESVGAGTLAGDGPGKSAEGRLGALINMIEAAGNLIDAGDPNLLVDTCGQLQSAYNRTDGNSPPPDFVAGDSASELASKIQELMTSLGCE